MTRNIFILGAGASGQEGAPLQKDLLREYINQFHLGNIPPHISKEINPFLRDFFGISINDSKLDSANFPTFEEILGMLEFSDIREEYFRYHIKSKPRLLLIKRYLSYLIAIVLEKKLSHHYGEYHHFNLLKRLQDMDILWDTTFINLNYDIILDNSIIKGLFETIDYGCQFFNYHNHGEVKVYKLHGSLNWLYCPSCNSLILGEGIKIAPKVIYDRNITCDSCQSNNLQPLIIPPTYFKSMANLYIQQVWHNTEKQLRDAERIFICGYSFPESDIHIKYLLKRAEIFNPDRKIQIYIVNGRDSPEEEKKRFQRFFKFKQGIHYTGLTFEEFSNQGIPDSERTVFKKT